MSASLNISLFTDSSAIITVAPLTSTPLIVSTYGLVGFAATPSSSIDSPAAVANESIFTANYVKDMASLLGGARDTFLQNFAGGYLEVIVTCAPTAMADVFCIGTSDQVDLLTTTASYSRTNLGTGPTSNNEFFQTVLETPRFWATTPLVICSNVTPTTQSGGSNLTQRVYHVPVISGHSEWIGMLASPTPAGSDSVNAGLQPIGNYYAALQHGSPLIRVLSLTGTVSINIRFVAVMHCVVPVAHPLSSLCKAPNSEFSPVVNHGSGYSGSGSTISEARKSSANNVAAHDNDPILTWLKNHIKPNVEPVTTVLTPSHSHESPMSLSNVVLGGLSGLSSVMSLGESSTLQRALAGIEGSAGTISRLAMSEASEILPFLAVL